MLLILLNAKMCTTTFICTCLCDFADRVHVTAVPGARVPNLVTAALGLNEIALVKKNARTERLLQIRIKKRNPRAPLKKRK